MQGAGLVWRVKGHSRALLAAQCRLSPEPCTVLPKLLNLTPRALARHAPGPTKEGYFHQHSVAPAQKPSTVKPLNP